MSAPITKAQHPGQNGARPSVDTLAVYGEATDLLGLVLAAQEITCRRAPVPGFMDGYVAMTPDQLTALNAVLSAARDKSQALAEALDF